MAGKSNKAAAAATATPADTDQTTDKELAAPTPAAPALDGEIITGGDAAPSADAGDAGGGTADMDVAQPASDTNTTVTTDGATPAGSEEDSAEAAKEGEQAPASALADDDGNDEPTATVLFVYWPNIAVRLPGGLGVGFDENGTGEVTEEQAAWLAEQIAAGNLPEPPEPVLPEEPVERVSMVRDAPQFEGGPTTADVHPDEVSNWLADGWLLPDHP